MAEDHRRVEARQIIGTGMATDPERLQRVAAEAERHERTWREAPEASFGEVMGRVPGKGELTEPDAPPRRRRADDEPSEEEKLQDQAQASASADAKKTPAKLSLRAPDPRARALHAALDLGRQDTPSRTNTHPPPTTETPPTGTAGLKPPGPR